MYIGFKSYIIFSFGKTNPQIAIYVRGDDSAGGLGVSLTAPKA